MPMCVCSQVMDAVVIIAALVLNPRAERRRREAAEAAATAGTERSSTVDGEATPRNTASRVDVEKAADGTGEKA